LTEAVLIQENQDNRRPKKNPEVYTYRIYHFMDGEKAFSRRTSIKQEGIEKRKYE